MGQLSLNLKKKKFFITLKYLEHKLLAKKGRERETKGEKEEGRGKKRKKAQ